MDMTMSNIDYPEPLNSNEEIEEKIPITQIKLLTNTENLFSKKSMIGMFMVCINITNHILGGGIIVLPAAMKMSGVGMGIILQGIASGLCGFTFIALGYCCEISEAKSYPEMVKKMLGPFFRYVTIFCQLIFPISVGITYCMAVADNMESFLTGIWPNTELLKNRAFVLFFPLYVIAFPMCITKKVKYLEKLSILSIGLVLLYISAFLWRLRTIPYEIIPMHKMFTFSGSSIIQSLPIFAFASSCHQNAINFYTSQKYSSIIAFGITTNVSIIFTNILYIIVALTGFITFGGDPPNNIFEGYCKTDVLINIMRLIFALTIILTLPFQILPPKIIIINTLFKERADEYLIKIGTTFGLLTVCYVIASIFRDISVILSIGGAITNVPILYIIPSLCLLSVIGKPYIKFEFRRILSWMCLICGIIMFFACPILTILSIMNHGNKHSTIRYYCDN